MEFLQLEQAFFRYSGLTVIGRDVPHQVCLLGLGREGDRRKLWLLEPFLEGGPPRKGGVRNHRRMLKLPRPEPARYLDVERITIGDTVLECTGGSAQRLQTGDLAPEGLGLLWAMLQAGWQAPAWLKDYDLQRLQLVELELKGTGPLPVCLPGQPVLLRHGAGQRRHLVEKNVTLQVGKGRTITFTGPEGQPVKVYVDKVRLVDLWAELEKRFSDPKGLAGLDPKRVKLVQRQLYGTLQRTCPPGSRHIALEYGCEQGLSLQFYTKDYLRSPVQSGPDVGMAMRPSITVGPQGLPLRGCILEGAVPADTEEVQAELFCCYVPVPDREERL